ncbi:MAG: low molecular weight protein-tyrosine-phosphatase [Bacteroidota bacterium]|nr:low molecular weight protein-tyrosine-phosphatase [Bacteroidota bacterium]
MKHIVFVCLGNICRSPLAEAIFKQKLKERGISEQTVFIDSCGTNGFHNGEKADPRTRANAQEHGVDVTSVSRQLTLGDIMDADYVITMANDVYQHVLKFCRNQEQRDKIYLFRKFDPSEPNADVPDPWYNDRFEEVFQIVNTNCDLWLQEILSL